MRREWPTVELGSVIELINGRGFKSSEWKPTGIPIIRISNLNGDTEFNKYDGDYDSKHYIKENDLLFSWSGNRGTSFGPFIWQGPNGLLNQHIFKINIKKEESVKKEYLYYALLGLTKIIENSAHGGSGLVHVKKTDLVKFKVSLPDFKEQNKIAAILTSVDKAIEKTEAIIEQIETVKKGLMQELLTKGIGHTEFKETEIGVIPDEWKLISLEDLTIESAFGPRFPSDKYDIAGNYALLRTTDINKSGNINYQTMPLTKLPEENFEKHVLKENDLLITRSGTCGIVTVFKGFEVPVIPGAFLIRFRLNEMVNPEFAKLFMMSNIGQSKIQTMASGGVQKNLSGTNLKKLILPLPTIHEQEKIITVHRSLEDKIGKEEKTLVYFQKLKLALMQVLLTGKVRVQVDDPKVIHS